MPVPVVSGLRGLVLGDRLPGLPLAEVIVPVLHQRLESRQDRGCLRSILGLAETITDPERVKILQLTVAACFPSLVALPRFNALCRDQANGVTAFLKDNKPDLIILSADWRGYSRRTNVEDMMKELNGSLSELKARGIPVVVIGPSIQFRSTLPSMILRAEIRNIDPSSLDDLVVRDIFALDRQMKSLLLVGRGISFLSILDAVCPAQKCPIIVGNGAPLSFDHAHLTVEGSVYIAPFIAAVAGLFTLRSTIQSSIA